MVGKELLERKGGPVHDLVGMVKNGGSVTRVAKRRKVGVVAPCVAVPGQSQFPQPKFFIFPLQSQVPASGDFSALGPVGVVGQPFIR